jgi:DNA-binding CsgD family transcriptional regulator
MIGLMASPMIEEGWAALRAGDAAAARAAFARALEQAESGAAREGLGQTLYLQRDYLGAIAAHERAYAAYLKEGEAFAAGRAARNLAWITGNVLGDWAVHNGWLARARRILEEVGDRGAEHGWVLIIKSYTEPDAAIRQELCREAIAIGRAFADPNIEIEALASLGALYLMIGRTDEGLALLDESMAALCAGELTEIATMDNLFCGLFWACELVNDVSRADQWIRASSDVMTNRNAVAAFCRAHYGGILTAAGRWQEAEAQLTEAVRQFDRGMPQRRGAAIIRLADLRVRQGRLEEAGQLLKGLEQHPDAVRVLAGFHLARGDVPLARDLLERATEGPDDEVAEVGASSMKGPLLALLVDVYLEQGCLEEAEQTAQRLHEIAKAQHGAYLTAAAALAKGRVCVATGRGDARACLNSALEGFAEAQLPMELARARLEMGYALAERSPEVAVAEAKTALEDFERLEAARYADEAAALLRSLGAPIRTGPKGVGALTRREAEVLELIGAGLSNSEIGDRLYITRKTVEHHVGNVLSKLGPRNRAEAAGYVLRQQTSL